MSLIDAVTDQVSGRARQRGRDLARRDMFIWAAAILFLNQLYTVVKEMPSASLEASVSDLLAIGILLEHVTLAELVERTRIGHRDRERTTPIERPHSRHHLVGHDAQGVDVRARIQ